MTDVAAVGVAVETDGIEKGIKKLGELAQQGPKVEKAMQAVSGESRKVAKSLADLGASGGDGLKKTGEAAAKAAAGIKASGTAAREAVTDTASLARAVASLTAEEEKHIRQLVEEANGLRMTRGEMEAYRAAQKGMSVGAQEIARATGDRIEALKAEKAALSGSNDLMQQAANLAKGLFAGVTFTAFATKLVGVQREFDKLNSSLITVTGSSANAESQMAWIKDFAKETPFGLAQATAAFVKMKSLGLDPTQQALTSFGNTASAMGKDLNQMIEAVADASTGEFERLKEFGIKASKDGEQIKFTFQGISTTVRNSAEEITKYLEEIGNNQFAGAMAERAKTLDGAISELGDTWDELFRTINQQNTGQFIYESVKLAASAVDDLTTIIRASNQAMADGAQAGQGFTAVQDAIATVFETVVGLGLNVKYVLTQVGNEIGGLAAQAAAIAQGNFAGAATIRAAMVADAEAARAAVDAQTEAVLRARKNAKEIADYRKQIADSALGNLAGQVDGFKPSGGTDQRLANQVDSLLKSTNGLKSQAEAMAEVRKQAGELDGALKQLRDAGKGDSEQARQLEARIQGVNEKLDSMAKSGQDRSAAAAIKHEQSEYEKLISSIQLKIMENEEELKYGHKLSEAEKLRFMISEQGTKKLTEDHRALAEARLKELEDGEKLLKQKKLQAEAEDTYRKYLDTIYKSASALGDLTAQQDAANATFGKSKVAIAEMAAEQAKLAALNAKDMGPWTPEQIAALAQLANQHERYVKSLREGEFIASSRKYEDSIKAAKAELELQQYGMSLLGEEEITRNKLIAIRKAEIKLEKELLDLAKQYQGRDDSDSVRQRAELEGQIRINAETELQGELGRIQDQYVNEQVNKYGDIFRQGFADMMNNGKDGWKSFTKSLTTTFKTTVADQIYKMFTKHIVVNLVASLSGGGGFLGTLAGLFGLAGGGGGGGGGGSDIFSLASNGKTAYDLYNGQGMLWDAGKYVAGKLGFGWGAAGVQPSGAVTTPVVGSLGAPAPGAAPLMSTGAMVAMAIPFIAAYLGGMFKEERMVGQGLTGELGGDMYGYQLMRESGGLFDGPDYRYVVAEKEIKAIDAKIEKLKTDNPYAHLGERGNARRDAELQKLYNQKDVLERNYSGAIDGSHGAIKILQDAFEAMREDTAKRADILGLDGDSIRKMKVALGVDEIHPDTGGKGLQLTGLTQEEAAAKIQQALAQANEEMARSILGTWEEQTKEVTRVIWENVRVDGDGDTEQFRRVAKEYKETVTEQVFVMGEYVREGETAVQALTRLSSSLVGVNSVFELLGVTLLEGSLSAADWASKLVDAVGSMDALVEAAGKYYDLYYSDSEKQAFVAEKANKGMADKGLDLRVGDANAKEKYRAMVEKAIADGDEEFLAWLLTFADDFAAGVDAATAAFQAGVDAIQEKLAEIQRIRDETLSTLGLSMDGLVDGFIGEINAGRGAQAGEWLADTIAGGFEQAIYGQAVNIIMSSIIDGVITPMVTAAMTGSVVTEAVSGAAIETMVANARAAADALSMLLNDPTFREGLEKVLAIVKNLGNEIGSSIAPQQSAQRATEDARRAEADRAATQAAQERYNLETRLLQLQGNTAALRQRELAQLDPANRALQQQIWAMEDAKAAQQAYADSLSKAQSAYESAMSRMQSAQSTVDSIRAQGTQNYIDAQKAVQEAQERIVQIQLDAANEIAKTFLDLGMSLRDWLTGQRNSDGNAQVVFQQTLAKALAGDADAMMGLTEAAQAADAYARANAVSQVQYELERARILAGVSNAAGVAEVNGAGYQTPDPIAEAQAALVAANTALADALRVATAINAPLQQPEDSLIAQYTAALQELNDANAALAAQQAALDSIKSGVWDTSTKTGQVNSSVGNVYGATNSVNSSVGNVYGATNQVKTGVDYVGEQIRQLVMLNVKLGEIASSVRSLEVQNPDIITRLYSIMNSTSYQTQAFTSDGYVRVKSQNRDGTASWFAQGGIVDGMTPFAFGGGQLGIMGEAGPEAIMPTQRMSNGDLGVRVQMPRMEWGGYGRDPALIAEIRELRAENRAQAAAMVNMQRTLVRLHERWDRNGIPETRSVE